MNEDPTDAKGMATLVNKRKVDEKLDLDAIEKDVITYYGKTTKIRDPSREYESIMRDVRRYDNSSNNTYFGSPTPNTDKTLSNMPERTYVHENFRNVQKSQSNLNQPTFGGLNTEQAYNGQYPSVVGDDSDDESDEYESEDEDSESEYDEPPVNVTNGPRVSLPRSTVPFSSHSAPQSYSQAPQSYSQASQPQYHGYQAGHSRMPYQAGPSGYAGSGPVNPNYSQQNPYQNAALQAFTGQEKYQESLLEEERKEERKEKMIADIDELRDELAQDDIDTSRIPEVNGDTPFEDVERVYKILKRKYDRSRCEDLGKGVVMAGARMLEMA